MEKNLVLSLFALAISIGSSAAIAHAEHGQPQYGGVVAEAGMAQFELVSQGDKLIIHVTQHGQPQSTTGATGKLTILEGAKKSEFELKPSGENRLEAKGSAASGAKVLISVQLADKSPLQARAVMK